MSIHWVYFDAFKGAVLAQTVRNRVQLDLSIFGA